MGFKRRKFADDGWAFWIDGDDTSSIFLNDWLNLKGKSFIDIAVRIKGIRNSKTLNVFIPFSVEKDEIEDISLKFSDMNVLRATFNAACIIDYKKNECTSEIAYNGKTVDVVHIFCLDFEIKPLAYGSFITIDLEKLNRFLDNDEAYFIFRVPHKSIDVVLRSNANVGNVFKRLRDLLTSPVVSENYGYSIRINESRLLPEEINRIGAFHRQKLEKATVTISLNESFAINDSGCYRIRRLEEDLYKYYKPSKFKTNDVITYQWNQNREVNLKGHFNFYFDIARNTVRKWSLMLYLIIFVCLGAMGNALWDIIKLLFDLQGIF